MTIEQIRTGFDNFSYIIYCPIEKKAAIVDPGYNSEKLIDRILTNKLDLHYIINTHYHSDHTGQNNKIRNKYPNSMIIASETDGKKIGAEKFVSDNEQIKLGKIPLKFISTPGHTLGGICIIVNNEAIITGDTLFIGDCGRTDLPGGSLKQMYKTLHKKIIFLSDNLIVYPGHDYGDKPYDTLGNQKKTNKTLTVRDFEDFSKIS